MKLPTVNLSKDKQGQDLSSIAGIAIPGGGILISLLIAVLIIWPKVNEILKLKTDNKELTSRVEVLEAKAKLLSGLDHEKLEEQLASAEQLLPSDGSVFGVLRQVEDTANSTGVLLQKIEAVSGIEQGGLRNTPVTQSAGLTIAPAVQINLSLVSDYQSLLSFLSSLYSFSRAVSIDTISIGAGRTETAQLSTSFTVNAHWKELPQTLGSIEAPVQSLTPSEEQRLANVKNPQAIETLPVPPVPTGRGNPFDPY